MKKSGRGHSHDPGSMNMRGAFLHVLSDALGSIIVVISALIVWKTEWKYRYYMDPALSIVLVCLILHSVWPLLRESALILLQTVPTHIQVNSLIVFSLPITIYLFHFIYLYVYINTYTTRSTPYKNGY